MEPAILGVLAIMLTVMLYLDRTRRADIGDMRADHAGLREEMNANTAALREEMNANTAALREEMNAGFARTEARIDQLTTAVINLAESLGQVKGRTEVLVASE